MNTSLLVLCIVFSNLLIATAYVALPAEKKSSANSNASAKLNNELTGQHRQQQFETQAAYPEYSPDFIQTYMNNPRYLQALYEAAAQFHQEQQQQQETESQMPAAKRSPMYVRFGKRAQTFVRFG